MNGILKTSAILALLATPAFSVGSDDNDKPAKTETTTECEEGQVWDEDKEECVSAENIEESNLSDDQLYKIVRELAYDGQFLTSLRVLDAFADQNDPRVWNYKGFNTRNLGDTDAAFAYYEKAIALDPGYSLARSYYGQGLLKSGNKAGAYQQLAMIAENGDRDSWAFKSLQIALDKGRVANY